MIAILERFGFAVVSQRGSHAKLRRLDASGARQTCMCHVNRHLDQGTLRALFREACGYVPKAQLAPFFIAE